MTSARLCGLVPPLWLAAAAVPCCDHCVELVLHTYILAESYVG